GGDPANDQRERGAYRSKKPETPAPAHGPSGNRDATQAEPSPHVRLDGGQPIRRARLESQHQNRLGVRRADETPAIAEQHPRAVDIDDIVPRTIVRDGFVDDREFAIIRAV